MYKKVLVAVLMLTLMVGESVWGFICCIRRRWLM